MDFQFGRGTCRGQGGRGQASRHRIDKVFIEYPFLDSIQCTIRAATSDG